MIRGGSAERGEGPGGVLDGAVIALGGGVASRLSVGAEFFVTDGGG